MKANAGVLINISQVPKVMRKKAKLIRKLWQDFNIIKLREVRDSTTSMKINIYHHSFGTDSYYHDIDGTYNTWDQLHARYTDLIDKGENAITIVMPYRAGILFYKSSLSPNPSLN